MRRNRQPPARSSPVRVLVCTSLPEELYQRIVNLDRRALVRDGAAQTVRELPEALRPGQAPPPERSPGRTLDELLAEAEVILAARRIPPDLAKRAPRLRWVQLPLAGAESGLRLDIWKRPEIAITMAAGANAAPVAEYVLAAMLAFAKDLRRMAASQADKKWDRSPLGQLRGRTLGIVGYGAVGREVARLGQAFGMRVLAVKRRVTAEERMTDWVMSQEHLPRLLEQADYVVLCVPSTAATRGMIGLDELALMRPTAVLINVARGDVVDEEALVEALREGRIAGAALDVFQQEPLPPTSRLWGLPNVLVSAHVAGLFEGYDAAVVELFCANLRRYLDGDPLLNVVDRTAGY